MDDIITKHYSNVTYNGDVFFVRYKTGMLHVLQPVSLLAAILFACITLCYVRKFNSVFIRKLIFAKQSRNFVLFMEL
jgi:hypothetical protein